MSEEYWNIAARLRRAGSRPSSRPSCSSATARTVKIGNKEEADAVLADLGDRSTDGRSVTTKERKKSAVPPFITSKLQQASRFPVKKTMMIAQQLYEGIELPGEGAVGLITYMRTDSTRVSDQALERVREFIGERLRPRLRAREAELLQDQEGRAGRARSHSSDLDDCAIPAGAVRAHLTPDQYYLYRLIWNRFVASQMPPATFDETTVDIDAPRAERRRTVPGQGLGAEVRRLDGGLQPGATRGADEGAGAGCGQRRGRGRIEPAAAARRRRSARD